MSKYMVVEFDRYDTHKSRHTHVEADSPLEAAIVAITATRKALYGTCCMDDGEGEYLGEMIEHPDEIFSCIAGEEEDILIYKV